MSYDRRDHRAALSGETAELIAMRNAFQRGTPAQRAEARAWFCDYEVRMAEASGETRAAAPQTLSEDEQYERELEWALELALKYFGGTA